MLPERGLKLRLEGATLWLFIVKEQSKLLTNLKNPLERFRLDKAV